MIELLVHAEGVLLPVKGQPGSRVAGVKGEQNGALKVAVTQVAEKGKANKAIIEVLCAALAVRKSQVTLVSGETASHKQFLIRDIALDELRRRIEQVLSRS
jgi:uncharacterized protein (TIGR00251 family)